jgi:hypothetical protein
MAPPGGIAPAAPSRHVVAQLSTGGFLLLVGALFAVPFLLNSSATGNDAFLTNIFLAPLISLVGSLLYILALRRLGLSIALMLVLIAINLAALTSWLWLPQVTSNGVELAIGVLASLPVALLVDAALLFVIGALVARAHGQLDAWTRSILLALVTSGALAVVYSFFGGHYLAEDETTSSLPPYLNEVTLGSTTALAALAYLLGWRWGSRGIARITPSDQRSAS